MVIDLGLPGMDGLGSHPLAAGAGQQVADHRGDARTSDLDFVVGLDAGADDYGQAVPYRRAAGAGAGAGPARFEPRHHPGGELIIESAARRVRIGDDEVNLTPKEYDVLLLLSQNVGRVMSREQIMKEIWRGEWYGGSKTLDMHVSGLRRKPADVGRGAGTGDRDRARGGFRLEDEPAATASAN